MQKFLSSTKTVEEAVYAVSSQGFLGAAGGEPGFAYGRVSGDDQADQGSGLERQLANISEVAAKHNIFIPIEMIFLDDHSGFEFRDRPALSELRKEYMSPRRRASIIVMEYLDRLSRNADWQQGFLLDEMKQYNVRTLFWKGFSSRIERSVMGAISQDGMELTKERMKDGIRRKAEKGMVTSKYAAYGYMLVDSAGNPHGNVRKDTHYAINEDEARWVQYIYEQLAYHGSNLHKLATDLQDRGVPRRDSTAPWDHGYLSKLVRNPVYKGEFTFGQTSDIKVQAPISNGFLGATKEKRIRIYHPKENWVVVPVPPIVTPALWDAANRACKQNKTYSERNSNGSFILTGMVKCAECGSTFHGATSHNIKKDAYLQQYRCSSRAQPLRKREELNCHQGTISKKLLEGLVWDIARDVLLHPEPILKALDDLISTDTNSTLEEELKYLERQLVEIEEEDRRLLRAYNAKVFDEVEYAELRADLKRRKATAQQSIKTVASQIISPERIAEQKEAILMVAAQARARDLTRRENIDDETKRSMIQTLFNKIVLDLTNGEIAVEGLFSGAWAFERDGKNVNIVGSLDY